MIVLKGLGATINRLHFSPDASAVFASGFGGGDATAVWRLPEGGAPARYADVIGVAFEPGGRSVVAAQLTGAGARFGRVGVGADGAFEPGSEPEADFWLNSLTLSPDGLRLAAGRHGATLAWWAWPEARPLPAWPLAACHGLAPVEVAFSPDGAAVAVFQHEAVTRHDGVTGEVRWTADVRTTSFAGCLAWSPDGRWIAAGSGKRLRVLDAADGRTVQELTQPSKHFLDAEFTRDGRFLATVSNEATVKFFDASWALRHELAWRVGGLRAIAFSKDGMLAAAGGAGKKVVVWDLDL